MAKQLRLDKFLCEQEVGSRSEVKIFLKKGQVTVNGVVCKSPDTKIDPEKDVVSYQGKDLSYQQFYYYMLHKPAGFFLCSEDGGVLNVFEIMCFYLW